MALLSFLPLVPLKLLAGEEKEKAKYITFELKICMGMGAGASTYKNYLRMFDEETPQEWMDVIHGIKEIWKQNSVNALTD